MFGMRLANLVIIWPSVSDFDKLRQRLMSSGVMNWPLPQHIMVTTLAKGARVYNVGNEQLKALLRQGELVEQRREFARG